MWFKQLEGRFASTGITAELTSLNYVVGNVDTKTLELVSDLVEIPPCR